MSLLSKKTDDKSKEKVQKKKKFKRRKDVFGKRLIRIWLILLVAVEITAVVVSSFIVKQKQDNKQEKIDAEISTLNSEINNLLNLSHRRQTTYEDIGTLVATLPSSFDKQTCNIDLDRLLSLSGLNEDSSLQTPRSFTEGGVILPFTVSVATVKAVEINLNILARDIQYINAFLDNVTNYEQENFFYVDDIEYYNNDEGTFRIRLFTFYNDVNV